MAGHSGYSEVASIYLPREIPLVTNVLVASNAVWKYLDDGSDKGTAWTAVEFDDSTWRSGRAELGYGNADQTTIVGYGPDPANRYITTYLRHAFVVDDPSIYTNLFVELLRDDGVVVHLNGQELFRHNMPEGPITHTSTAVLSVDNEDEKQFYPINLSPALLVSGVNVLAVDLHQNGPTSADLGFNIQITATGEITESDPTRVTNLIATASTMNSVQLAWTAPASGNAWGGLVPYDLRLSRAYLNDLNWATATAVVPMPVPAPPGTPESVIVSGLERGTSYYFALRISDGLGNISRLSNLAIGTTEGLAMPWSNQDVGAVGIAGQANRSNDVYVIRASGADIAGSQDAFHFAYLAAAGDCEIQARVMDLANAPSAKAGVMIRESLNPDSRYAMMVYTAGNSTQFQRRSATGGSTTTGSTGTATAPYWLRLVRSGTTFTAYRSSTGASWSTVTSTTISMNTNVLVGLAVTSRNNSALTTARFDQVTVTP